MKTSTFIWIMIVLIVLAIGGEMFYANKRTEPPATAPKTYTDARNSFHFTYPADFAPKSVTADNQTSWSMLTDRPGALLAQVAVGNAYQPGTNFSEAKFSVGSSTDAAAVANCLVNENGATRSTTTVMIGGVTYTKLTASDAGAGNFYDTTSYRTVKDNTCYAIEYTIHSTHIGNYPPEQGIKEFDKTAVNTALENIVTSFTFLK